MTEVTFLGTGNYLAAGRYWNSFMIDRTILVEPSPIALPHFRTAGFSAAALDVVVISHFHADHTFGWPFLLLELLRSNRTSPLFVVGPPALEEFLASMLDLAGVPDVAAAAAKSLDLRHIEVDGAWQVAADLRFRAVEVDHVDHLRCFGYLFQRGQGVLAYSGDTRPCAGLDELAANANTLILECNSQHSPPSLPVTHMDVPAVRALRDQYPHLPFVLTHIGRDVSVGDLENVTVPNDFASITV